MNQNHINEQLQDTSEEHETRRSVLRQVGLMVGAFVAGGTLLRGTEAQAQGGTMTGTDGTTMTSSTMAGGTMMADGSMMGGMGGSTNLRVDAAGNPVPGLTQLSQKGARRIPASRTTGDIAILNSALLLEYLESEFYSRAVAADMERPYLKGRVKNAALVLQRDEGVHVDTVAEMITRLGGQPISKPVFQFPAGVFVSQTAFLSLSSILEENGVSAYLGAAPHVRNKEVLNFAASIYGVEARHSGLIRYLMGEMPAPRDLEKPISLAEATANAAPYLVKDAMTMGTTGG